MRVLHVGKFYPPVSGGMERVLETICQASLGLVESRVLVAHAGRGTIEETIAGVQVTRIGTIGSAGSVNISPGFATALRRIRTDVIVFHEPNPWALLSYAMARPAAPLILWYHSDVVRPALQYALFYAPMARVVYRRARRIVVSSPPLAEHAAPIRPFRDRVTVIPFGIDPAAWSPSPARDRSAAETRRVIGGPFVLFAGRLVAYKGVDVLLEALASLDVRAVIAGDGPQRPAWERMARDKGLGGRVTFTGEVEREQLVSLFHACEMLVLPSVTRAEAFGYVQLEAMASGKPVISTDVPSGVSWVNRHGETGLVVPAGDAAALRDAMAALMSDPERRARLGRAGQARVESEFTLGRLRQRLGALFGEFDPAALRAPLAPAIPC